MIQPGSSHAQKEEAPEVMKLLDALCGEVFEEITKEIAHLLRGNPDPLRMVNVQHCIACAACSLACPSGIDLVAQMLRAAEFKKGGE